VFFLLFFLLLSNNDPWTYQINNLHTQHRQSLEKKRHTALMKWTDALESVHSAVVFKTGVPSSHGGGPEVPPPEVFAIKELEGRWS
jgi:COP9 signalosome complex subunit 2